MWDMIFETRIIFLIMNLIFPITTLLFKTKNFNSKNANLIILGIPILTYSFLIFLTIDYLENGNVEIIFFKFLIANIGFKIESFGIVFAHMASILWIITSLYSIGYLKLRKLSKTHAHIAKKRFYVFTNLAIFATFGIAFANNLVTMFIFYEILTLLTYPLVTILGAKADLQAGKKYLKILISTSQTLLLPAVIFISFYYDITFDMPPINNDINENAIIILLIMVIYGASKAAIMPLHSWLPGAMNAPAPVSALLHAVAVVKSGVYVIIKIVVFIFGIEHIAQISDGLLNKNIFIYITCFSMIISSFFALKQIEIKKMLAYSTINNLSICVLAVSLFGKASIFAAMIHMIAHSIAKINMFFGVGSFNISAEKKYIDSVKGISSIMPITCFCILISALSLIGIPPFAGFWSKFYILLSSFDHGLSLLIFATLLITTVMSCIYYGKLVFNIYDVRKKAKHDIYIKIPKASYIAQLIIALLVLSFGLIAPNLESFLIIS